MSRESREIIHTVSTATVLRVVAILAFCAALFFLRDAILAILVAVVIASAVEPGTKWFVRRRIPRVVAVIIQYLLLAVVLSLLFYFLLLPLLDETLTLIRALPDYVRSADLWNLAGGGVDGNSSVQEIANEVSDTLTRLSQGFFAALSGVFGGVLSFLFILVLSFYLSVQENGIARFLSTVTPKPHRQHVLSIWSKAELKIGRWMQGQLMLAVIIFCLVYVCLLAIGVEHALLLAVLAGILEIIPIFGPIIAAIPAVILAFLGGGLTTMILVVIVYVVIQQLENQLIYPLVVKKVVGVPPMVSILAIVVGGQLLGFLGIILSVPVAAVIMEYYNDYQRHVEEEAREG